MSKMHYLRGVLLATSAVHVGADRRSAAKDLPVVRDGLNRPLIPGTSLAGALRRLLLDAGFTPAEIDRWLGEDTADRSRQNASVLVVDDAPALWSSPATEPAVETRLTTALEAGHGVPKASALFSREVLPAGTKFELSLELEERKEHEGDAVAFLSELIRLLEQGITLGAATTRGLGRLRLESVEYRVVDFDERQSFLDFLSAETYVPFPHPEGMAEVTATAHTMTLSLPFDAGPLMSSVAIDGAVDRVPLTTANVDGKLTFVLPGSGTKGALRARARYILGTLGADEPDGDEAFKLLFGVVSDDSLADQKAPFGRGRLTVSDSTAGSVDRDQWAQVVNPDAGEGGDEGDNADARRKQRRHNMGQALTNLGDPLSTSLVVADRVAIDRWTGGAADQRLFSLLEPHGLEWSPITLDLNLRDIADDLAQRAIGLLLLTVREVVEGWVPLGYGTRRGLGRIVVKQDEATIVVGQHLTAWAGLGGTLSELLHDQGTAARAVEAFVTPYGPVEAKEETV